MSGLLYQPDIFAVPVIHRCPYLSFVTVGRWAAA